MSDENKPCPMCGSESIGERYYEAYDKNEADVMFAALERRVRVAARALLILRNANFPITIYEAKARAEREIESEKGEQK